MNHAIEAALEARAGLIGDVASFIYAHPEPAHQEYACSAYLADLLDAEGFTVERGVAEMETAFVATADGAGPRVGLVAVYDAVTALDAEGTEQSVHSCGHGSISGGVVGAALVASELGRSVSVMGLPADELHSSGVRHHGGGKQRSAQAGLWNGLDAALYIHPEFINTVSLASLWGRHLEVVVDGRRSLRNDVTHVALDALAAAHEAGSTRPGQVMLERLVLDGDVEEDARLMLRASFFVFADDETGLESSTHELRAAVPGGTWSVLRTIPAIAPDAGVTAAVAAAFGATGRDFVADPPVLPFATDFGAISRVVPSALVGLGRPGGWAFHTDAGASQFQGPEGLDAARSIAEVLAHAVERLGA